MLPKSTFPAQRPGCNRVWEFKVWGFLRGSGSTFVDAHRPVVFDIHIACMRSRSVVLIFEEISDAWLSRVAMGARFESLLHLSGQNCTAACKKGFRILGFI